jgi:hypothetical protein
MITMYLNQEVKSHTKRNIIAKKGDKVFILQNAINMILVVDVHGFKFWVNQDKLSIKPL